MKHPGLPEGLSLDDMRLWVGRRISEKRMRHSEGVASAARRLAEKAGADPFLAEAAALLHDACKEMKAKELVAIAEGGGLAVSQIERAHGHLLHGPAAAITVRAELGITNEEVLKAISEHTLGEAPMCRLSAVIFLADCIDETRPADYREPILAALDLDGACNIDRAIVVACDLGLRFLIEEGKPIHPRTVSVRNYYLDVSAGSRP